MVIADSTPNSRRVANSLAAITMKPRNSIAEVTDQGRRKKIIVFKMKRRKNYARTQGHRQDFTELKIREIQA